MSISTFKRYEMKFLLNKAQFEAILPRLMAYMNPDKYCQDGKRYSIYNIYYDTPDSHIIRASLSKPYYKEKLRLRSYKTPTSPDDKVFLEMKKKTGGIVHKRRATMTLGEAYAFIENGKRPEAKNYIDQQVINEIGYFLKSNPVSPAVYISYSRTALFGKENKDFRVTFDTNITTRREELTLEKGSFGTELLGKDQYLMEVKLSNAVPLWLAHALSEIGAYKTSFSKYGTEYKKYCLEHKLGESEIPVGAEIRQSPFILRPDICVNY